ncbi:MAG: hypothetical protein BWX61_01197 [Bacteroidetes bacterium ADurb.Bin035]|nr:MAG: hypothetical protein BWX61_01197 [Bacteroidetes bacterium ADurb.Bin035]
MILASIRSPGATLEIKPTLLLYLMIHLPSEANPSTIIFSIIVPVKSFLVIN